MAMNGAELAGRGAWVLHLATGVIGKASQFYDGVESCYHASDGTKVLGEVLRLEQGHAFVWQEDGFLELSGDEASFYVVALAAVETAIIQLVSAHAKKVDPERGTRIVRSAIEAQARALATGGV